MEPAAQMGAAVETAGPSRLLVLPANLKEATTEVIEIQGEKPRKSEHPPTAHTTGPNWLIFWRETPRVNTFGRTEAKFLIRPCISIEIYRALYDLLFGLLVAKLVSP